FAAVVVLHLVKSKRNRFSGALGHDSLVPTRVEFHIENPPTFDNRKASVKRWPPRVLREGESLRSYYIASGSVCLAHHSAKTKRWPSALMSALLFVVSETRQIHRNTMKILDLERRGWDSNRRYGVSEVKRPSDLHEVASWLLRKDYPALLG